MKYLDRFVKLNSHIVGPENQSGASTGPGQVMPPYIKVFSYHLRKMIKFSRKGAGTRRRKEIYTTLGAFAALRVVRSTRISFGR